MVYTEDNSNINKPGVSLGTNGIDWQPNTGGRTFLIMQGYPGWGTPTSGADVNGGNVIHFDASNNTWHFLFTDVKQLSQHSVFHATGEYGLGGAFVYKGIAVSQPGLIVNDIKRVNGHYIIGLHTMARTLTLRRPPPQQLSQPQSCFSHMKELRTDTLRVGLVVDSTGTKLLGALYGAGAVPTLTTIASLPNGCRSARFMSDEGEVLWSSKSSVGPNAQILRPVPGQDQQYTGRFHVYDVDHVDHDAPGTLSQKSHSHCESRRGMGAHDVAFWPDTDILQNIIKD